MTLEQSVSKTITYANFFGYQPSQSEVHHWLISPKRYSTKKVSLWCKDIPSLPTISKYTKHKISLAKKMIDVCSWFSAIQLVAVTGSVAANNAKKDDDIDLFIITSSNTLWLIRPFFLFILSFFFKRRRRGDPHDKVKDVFCPNLWLDESTLEIKDHNLYNAHEILQVIPILNRNNTFERFIQKNSWTKEYLANAYHLTTHSPNFSPRRGGVHPAHSLVKIANYIFYLLQLLYMYPHKTTEKVSLHSAFLHTKNYNQLISDYNNH